MWTKKRIFRIVVLAAVIVFAAIALDPRMVVRHYTVESDKISAPVRLAVVADFHGCDYGEGAERLIAAIQEQSPDAVLLVGDIFDDVLPWDDSEALVCSLAAQYPCFYVTGNHEYWSDDVDEICRIIESAGVVVLNASSATLKINGQTINICGIPDPSDPISMKTALQRAASDIAQAAFTVLLAHRPERIDKYAATGNFDLVVSGHAHGGQVRIPGILNGLFAPNQGLFPEYAGGQYQVEETTLIVSRGLARESTRLPRVFNRPELVIVELN